MQNFRLFASLAAMLVVAAGVVVAVLWQLGYFRTHHHWKIASGHPGGTYHQLGQQLTGILNAQLPKHQRFSAERSAGSVENMARIGNGNADFAFVQSNASSTSGTRLVATLYDEILHILVRSDSSTAITADGDLPLEVLSKLDKISLGPTGSGTNQVAQKLLAHFEIPLKSPPLHLAPAELPAQFEAGEIDAAFVLSAPGSQLVDQLLNNPKLRLLSLGNGPLEGSPAAAFTRLNLAFRAQLIPARLYGKQPTRPVHTIGVSALLVAANTVDASAVRLVTERLFRHRNALAAGLDTPLTLEPYTTDRRTVLPWHPGAEAYYLRERPSFLVVYAEVIALGITLLVGMWSICRLFLRWLADVKKERIDRFYREVRAAATLEPSVRLLALRAIHQRAFDELMREQLAANESFVIFHDYLLSEIARAERIA